MAKSSSTLISAAATATAAADASSTTTALQSPDIFVTRVGMEIDRCFAIDAESEIVMRSDRSRSTVTRAVTLLIQAQSS